MTKLRMAAWIVLTIAATYVAAEWSVRYKSGLHDLRAPVEQVAALRAASQPVRWASATRSDLAALARMAGFTKVEVRR